jgi:hypothetical protein
MVGSPVLPYRQAHVRQHQQSRENHVQEQYLLIIVDVFLLVSDN